MRPIKVVYIILRRAMYKFLILFAVMKVLDLGTITEIIACCFTHTTNIIYEDEDSLVPDHFIH